MSVCLLECSQYAVAIAALHRDGDALTEVHCGTRVVGFVSNALADGRYHVQCLFAPHSGCLYSDWCEVNARDNVGIFEGLVGLCSCCC